MKKKTERKEMLFHRVVEIEDARESDIFRKSVDFSILLPPQLCLKLRKIDP